MSFSGKIDERLLAHERQRFNAALCGLTLPIHPPNRNILYIRTKKSRFVRIDSIFQRYLDITRMKTIFVYFHMNYLGNLFYLRQTEFV